MQNGLSRGKWPGTSKNVVSCETAFESGLRAGGEENGRGFDQRNHPAAVDQFHLFSTFSGDDGDDLEARVGFDVYRRVDRPFSDAGDAPGKLIARGELQAAILGGQGDPRRFNQRDGLFSCGQAQRLPAAVGDNSHQLCAARRGRHPYGHRRPHRPVG